MSKGHTKKKWFIAKVIYQKSSYGSNVSSKTDPASSPILKHLEFN